MTDLIRTARRAIRKTILTEGYPGKIGASDGTVYYTDDNGNTYRNRVWVRLSVEGTQTEIVAWCLGVNAQLNLPVRAARRENGWTVIGLDRSMAVEYGSGRALETPPHWFTHRWTGSDPAFLDSRSFMAFGVRPSDPPSLTVDVRGGFYRFGGELKQLDDQTTSSLSSYLPSSTDVYHFVVVCLDRASNSIVIVDGNDKPVSAGSISRSDVAAVAIRNSYRPLAAIRLLNGQTEIRLPDIVHDVRPWAGEDFPGSDTHGLGHAISTMLALPGLRGLWPMSAIDGSGNAQDASGHGHHLTYNGNPTYNVDGLAPYIDLDGTGDYLSRADEADLDITGGESYVASAIQGLTLGGWFYHTATGSLEALITKWTAAGNLRAYLFRKSSNDDLQFYVSSDGSSTASVNSANNPTAATWYFAVARYTPSSELALFFNGSKDTETSSIPSSIFNSTADLQLGASDAGANLLDGRIALPFLCAAALSDDIIDNIYQQTRGLFGV